MALHIHYYLNRARTTITREMSNESGALPDAHATMSPEVYTRVCHMVRMIDANTFLSGEATLALKADLLATYFAHWE